jgi:histidyl-tRNA synthetase
VGDIIQPVRGMNDILPEQEALWARVEAAAAQIFHAYGYRRIRLPVLERTELFSRSIGEATDIVEKEMYTFEDRNGDSVTLRPEATAGVVRAGLSNGLLHNQQQRLWCSGPMFRREKPQKGRYRQFHQFSVEALGFADAQVDAELIVMSARLWRALHLQSPVLELNSLGTPEERSAYKDILRDYFSARRGQLDADSLHRLERNPLRILDSKDPATRALIAEAPLLGEHLGPQSAAHFERVQSLLTSVGVAYVINPRLVRGLDYYTHTVFEWLTDRLGAQGAICSGGRYDGLVAQLGGRDTPAVGWALGIERVVELMLAEGRPAPERLPDVYLVMVGERARREGFAIGEALRERVPGLELQMDLSGGGFRGQLKRADRSRARYALILGEDELATGHIGLKPLREEAPQQAMTLEAVAALLRAHGGAVAVQ